MLIDTIKVVQLQARKSYCTRKALSLTTLIGEAEAVGKNNGNRAPTDAEVIAVLKKFIKNNRETFDAVNKTHDTLRVAEVSADLDEEVELYESFLPKQLSEAELGAIIDSLIVFGTTNVGAVMKQLKADHAGLYDGAMASRILKGKFT